MGLDQNLHYKFELTGGTSIVNLTTPLVAGDEDAQTFRIELLANGEAATLTNTTCSGYFARAKTQDADADTLYVSGSISGNVATLTLTESCYSRNCYFALAIRLTSTNEQKRTVMIVRGVVLKSIDGELTDPDGSIPTVDELLAQIAVLERTIDSAEEATDAANAAAEAANSAAVTAVTEARAAIEELSETAAPAIIPTASGEVVTISDSADRPFAGLRLYGKTTQDGTPTPDAPVELVNAGASGSIGVYERGKNLVDITLGLGVAVTHPVRIAAGEYITIALYSTSGDTQYNVKFVFADGTAVDYAVLNTNAANDTWAYVSYKAAQEIAGLRFYDVYNNTPARVIDKVMAVRGQYSTFTDADYAPFAGHGLTASTPNGLPGIPVSSGGNYTDSEGQMWLSDIRDYGSGVDVQYVYHKRLDGSDDMTIVNNCFAVNDSTATEQVGAKIIKSGAITNYVYRDYYTLETGEYGVTYAYNWRFRLPDMNPDNNTVEEAKAWLASNPIDILVPMQAPIETALTEDEIAAYRAMVSHKPNTTVYNDGGAGMAVDYIADTKTYIDQRISALLA